MYDAIIVGGGPVGSRVAWKLAGEGHSVLVLERRAQACKSCCTGIVSNECVTSFGIEDGLVLSRANSATLFSPSGERLRLYRREAQACILDRAAFDAAMVRRARDRGAEYVFGSPVSNITIAPDKVRVAVSGNEQREYAGRAAVIASGFSPRLSQALGLGRITDYAIGVQAEVETYGADEVEVYFGHEVAPAFFAWYVPIAAKRARVGLLSREAPGPFIKKFMASLLARGRIASDGVGLHYGAVPLKPLSRTCGERLLVAGDAAGQVKPTTGGGIYYGLLCADIAAATLHEALEAGDLSARRLGAYEHNWRKKLGDELRIDYWARKLFEKLGDRQLDRVFARVRAGNIDEALLGDASLSFDWHSKAILKLMGYRAISSAMGALKLPFKRKPDTPAV